MELPVSVKGQTDLTVVFVPAHMKMCSNIHEDGNDYIPENHPWPESWFDCNLQVGLS